MTAYFLTAVILFAAVTSASAETFTYLCEVEKDHNHYHVVVLDLTAKTINWYGSTYENVKHCAKQCFSGTDKEDGTTAMLNTATEGGALLSVQMPGKHQVETFDCQPD